MSAASPLSLPFVWDLVAPGYTLDVVPLFENFAKDALRIANVRPGEDVLDVATGPGTLALLAAGTTKVSAVDFSLQMLEQLQARARESGLELEVYEADGMALPWEAPRFDAAFSMFGLMFFPERDRGFRQLLKVLRPGGRAVVSSWAPMSRTPVLRELFAALAEELPEIPFGSAKAPLTTPEELQDEMLAAGFADVRVEEAIHGFSATMEAFFESAPRSNAPLAMLRQKLGEARWETVSRGMKERLRATFGDAPQQIDMVALLGVGTKPA